MWHIDTNKLDDMKQDIWHIYDDQDNYIGKIYGYIVAKHIVELYNADL